MTDRYGNVSADDIAGVPVIADPTMRPNAFRLESETDMREGDLTGAPLGDVATATDPMETRTGSSHRVHRFLGGSVVTREELGLPPLEPARGLDALIPTWEPAEPLRGPETVAEALADVHARYCPKNAADPRHDPVCRILRAALEKPLAAPTGPKLGGQRQGGARAATEAAELVAPKAGTQRWRVLRTFVHYLGDDSVSKDVYRTDVDLANLTGLPANSVRPRRVELVDAGWLEAVPDAHKVHNGRKHTLWTLTPAAREALR